MSVQHEEALVTAAHVVHDQVWARHWHEGETDLRATQVIEYVRRVRTTAKCSEAQMPHELQKLMTRARESREANVKISLADLIVALKSIILPTAG